MKFLPAILFILSFLNCASQEKKFELQGQVVDPDLIPVQDAYIINLRTQERAVSRANGVFGLQVLPGDSLVITHVSFLRKKVYVFDLLKNPVVKLEPENVDIEQVLVSPNRKTDYELARENISSISEIKTFSSPKIKSYPERTMQLMTEHNHLLRSEATSVRIVRFSPSVQIRKLVKKLKKGNNNRK